MNDQYNIFKRLKDYEAQPPAELMQRIFNRLDADFKKNDDTLAIGELSQLQELEINPPFNIYSAIEQKITAAFQLSFLQDLQIAPPPTAFDSIIGKTGQENKKKTGGGGGMLKALYNIKAAAAIILLAIAGWSIYKWIQPAAKPVIETAKKNEPPAVLQPDSLKNNPFMIQDNIAAGLSKKAGKTKVKNAAPTDNIEMSVDDYKFMVLNGDLLAAFTSFDYRNLPSFITDSKKKGFSIRADQYAAISVSESMTKMIRKMNSYRRNGKLKVRAKKARAKLNKWKKADTEKFDKSLINNPLDPVDLAEFIFQ